MDLDGFFSAEASDEYGEDTEDKERLFPDPSSQVTPAEVKGGILQRREGRRTVAVTTKRVTFAADAIVLNAAMEGELRLLQQCIKKVKILSIYIYLSLSLSFL